MHTAASGSWKETRGSSLNHSRAMDMTTCIMGCLKRRSASSGVITTRLETLLPMFTKFRQRAR